MAIYKLNENQNIFFEKYLIIYSDRGWITNEKISDTYISNRELRNELLNIYKEEADFTSLIRKEDYSIIEYRFVDEESYQYYLKTENIPWASLEEVEEVYL